MSRWWGLRHVRYALLSFQYHDLARFAASVGFGNGWPDPDQLEFLEMVWRGRA